MCLHTSIQTTQKRLHDSPLIWPRHEQTEPLARGTRRSSVAVDVNVCGARDLVVDDVVDGRDIQPTRSDVCR